MKNAHISYWIRLAPALLLVAALVGCGETQAKEDRGFFTSGDRDADQRAEQRIAQDQQNKGQSVGGSKSDKSASADKANVKKSLYDRLGGEAGIAKIVDDFTARAIADPRVNWERKGVTKGGLSIHRNQSVEWQASDDKVATMKKHIAQFLALATGGPTTYEGREMKQAHAGLHIGNPEFDAAVGDLKQTLDKLAIATDDQKELLAIIESTRPQVVEER